MSGRSAQRLNSDSSTNDRSSSDDSTAQHRTDARPAQRRGESDSPQSPSAPDNNNPARRTADSADPINGPALQRSADNTDPTATTESSVTADPMLAALVPTLNPAGNEDWLQKLQMLLLSGSPELFMQQSPALALLSGHLEYVEPSQIPAIVAQSPLLQGILSTPNTADALQTAMPFEQNLKVLGLIPEKMPTEALGLEPLAQQPVVKIADTLKALGFDIKRVQQEGDLLKDNLSLDGLQSYMQRADRLRASIGIPLTLVPQDSALPLMTQQPQQIQKPNIQAVSSPQNPITNQPIDDALTAKLARLSPQNTVPLNAVQLWTQIPERPELMPLTVVDDGTNPPVFLAPMGPEVDSWDPFAQSTPDLAIDPNQPAPSMDSVPLVMNVLPRAPVAPQDPFLAMTQRWAPGTVQTLRPEDFAQAERSDFSADPRISGQQPMRSLDDLLHRHLIQPPELNNRMETGPLPTRDNTIFDISSLQISMQDLTNSSDQTGSDTSGQNSNSSFMNQDPNALFTPNAAPTFGNEKSFSIQTAAAPQAPSAPVSPQHLQDIFDKSSMLIKDGGGSIRVDLGSREMGPLDLALDIKGNNVELRIVTHSDQARDALVHELPRLRESLHNQHLNLDKVEIGLSYNSAWSQQSGNNRQNRDQFFENVSESSSRGPQGIRSTTRSYRQGFASGPEPRVPLHNGLIQVRV